MTMLLIAAAAGAALARRARLPGGVLLGALLGAAVVQLVASPPPLPTPVRVAAQILIGAAVGVRLRPVVLADVRRWLPAFLLALGLLLAAAAGAAALLVTAAELPPRTAVLAVLPGGAADITALLAAEGADAPVVAAVHLTRQLLVLVVVGTGVRWWARSRGHAPSPAVPRASAGAVLWRHLDDELQVLLVHRPRYDDWSLPKGGIEPGEDPATAAVRETEEETGWRGRPGAELVTLELRERRGPRGRKLVVYLALEAEREVGFVPSAEVDATRWFPLTAAARACSRPQDRQVLARFAAAPPAVPDPRPDVG